MYRCDGCPRKGPALAGRFISHARRYQIALSIGLAAVLLVAVVSSLTVFEPLVSSQLEKPWTRSPFQPSWDAPGLSRDLMDLLSDQEERP